MLSSTNAKRLFHLLARKAGLRVYRLSTMERGLSAWDDMARLLNAEVCPVVFDVGANKGQTVERILLSIPTAKIFCFEPVSTTFDMLVANHGQTQNVVLNHIALGQQSDTRLMTNAPGAGTNRLVEREEVEGSVEQVSMTTIDSYCALNAIDRIHVLKTDCEGTDADVIRGASQMIESGRIDIIFSEVSMLPHGGWADFYEIEQMMKRNFFTFYAFYDYSGPQYNVAEHGFMNALFVRSELLRRVAIQ